MNIAARTPADHRALGGNFLVEERDIRLRVVIGRNSHRIRLRKAANALNRVFVRAMGRTIPVSQRLVATRAVALGIRHAPWHRAIGPHVRELCAGERCLHAEFKRAAWT